MISNISAGLASGGTVDGDLTITGDFKVEGAGSFAFDEIIEGTQVIEKTSTEAFLVRKDSDGGDVFVVDTQDSRVEINGFLKFSNASYIQDIGNNYLKLRIASGDYFAIHGGASDTQYFKVANDGSTLFSGDVSIESSGGSFVVKNTGTGTDADADITLIAGAGGVNADFWKIKSDHSDNKLYFINGNDTRGTFTSSGTFTVTEKLKVDAVSGSHGILGLESGSGNEWLIVSSVASNNLDFYNGTPGTVMTITKDTARVGIGTISPAYKLDIVQSGDYQFRVGSSDNKYVSIEDDVMRFKGMTGNGMRILTIDSSDINFGTNTTLNRLVIKADGKIGIGTSSPDSLLEIESSGSTGHTLAMKNTSENANVNIKLDFLGNDGVNNNSKGHLLWSNTTNQLHLNSANNGLRFQVAETTKFLLDADSRMSLSNTDAGTDNTTYGKRAGKSIQSGGNYNAFVGRYAGEAVTTGDANTVLGTNAHYANVTGSNNTAIGYISQFGASSQSFSNNTSVGAESLRNVTTGNENTGLGAYALTSNTSAGGNTAVGIYASRQNQTGTGNTAVGSQALMGSHGNSHSNNTAVGKDALRGVTTGGNNTAMGFGAGDALTTGHAQVAIGYNALSTEDAGLGSVAVGYQALQNQNVDGDSGNVAVGSNSGNAVTTGTNNSLLGFRSGALITTGVDNTAIGKSAMSNMIAGAYNIAIGSNALADYKGDDGNNAGSKNIAIGVSAMEAFQGGTGDVHANTRFDRNIALGYNSFRGTDFNNAEVVVTDNIAIGDEALNSTGANGHVGTIAIGSSALTALTVGAKNTAIGYQAGMALGDCNNNTIIGYQAFKSANGGEHNNVVIGQGAGLSCDNASVDNNVIIGNGAGTGGAGSMVNCIYIGAEAGVASHPRNQNDNIFIGKGVAKVEWGGQCDDNVGIGSGVMSTGALNDAHGNVALGYEAMKTLTQSDNNVAIGKQALSSILAGAGGNVALGYLSGRDAYGTKNVFIGYQAGMQQTSGSGSINIGNLAGQVDSSSPNTIIGSGAFASSNNSSSGSNVIVGYEAGGSINSANSTDNVILGRGAGGGGGAEFTENIAIGSYALDGTGSNASTGQVAIGHYALSAVTSGGLNTAVGYQSGDSVTTGGGNTLFGYRTGTEVTDGHSNTLIGAEAQKDNNVSEVVAIGERAGLYNSATQNVFVGNEAGRISSTGTGQTYLGYNSGYYALGNNNTFVGKNSGKGGTTSSPYSTGTDNTAIGYEALASYTTGKENTGVGRGALTSVTTGNYNTAVGFSALDQTDDGARNVAVGAYSIGNANCGDKNVCIGYATGYVLTGSGNVALGDASLAGTTDGNRNVAIGQEALNADADDDNVAIGFQALRLCTGTDNVALGGSTGDTVTSGSQNTLLGRNAQLSANSGTNQIAVGYTATGQGDNTAVIGNASITDVYMGQDANTGNAQTEGANVLARSGYFKAVGLDHDKSGTDGVGDMENILLTLHGAYDDDAIGGRGIGMSFKMQDESTNVGEVGRISMIPRSGNMNSNLSAYGTEMYFYNSVGGTLTKQMEIEGGDSHARVSIFSNTSTHGLIVKNDGNNANRDGIYIQAGADDASGTTAYIDCQDGDGNQVGHISNTSGTFALTDVSDKRLKQNIVDTSVKGVETIDKMKVRDFEWIKSGDKMTAGFVAQELAEAFPSAVTGEDGAMEDILDDDYNKIGERIKPMGVSRDVLIPVLIKAVQELSARVKELEGK